MFMHVTTTDYTVIPEEVKNKVANKVVMSATISKLNN